MSSEHHSEETPFRAAQVSKNVTHLTMQQTGHPGLSLVREMPGSLHDYKMNQKYLQERERSQKLTKHLHYFLYTFRSTQITTHLSKHSQASLAITLLRVGLRGRAAQSKRKLRSHQRRGEKVNFSCLKPELLEFLRQEAELLCLTATLVF